MKSLQKQTLYNKLHKVSVIGLIGLTMFGGAIITHRAYLFFTVSMPKKREMKKIMAEEQMQLEQMEREADFVRRQRDAETLHS